MSKASSVVAIVSRNSYSRQRVPQSPSRASPHVISMSIVQQAWYIITESDELCYLWPKSGYRHVVQTQTTIQTHTVCSLVCVVMVMWSMQRSGVGDWTLLLAAGCDTTAAEVTSQWSAVTSRPTSGNCVVTVTSG